MCRVFGLQQYLTGAFGATRTTCDLSHQLRHLLLPAKVGAKQASIGVENNYERDIREMMPFGEHLRPKQDTRLAAFNAGERLAKPLFAASGVAIYSDYRRIWELTLQKTFGLLSAQPDRVECRGFAVRADARQGNADAAVMATQTRWGSVNGHLRYAVIAFGTPAAGCAIEHGGVAAPIDEY